MQDGIIAGNGNSRYLKTVSAALGLYPTYEDFMAALIAGTFPIDLNGINTAGWTQQGTALNKANLFSDTTASALGLSTSNTPNDALAKIKSLIDSTNANANSKVRMKIVSYVGTGTYGISNPTSISSDFPIKLAMFLAEKESPDYRYPDYAPDKSNIFIADLATTSYTKTLGFGEYIDGLYGKISSDKKVITWYNGSVDTRQNNRKGVTYYYLILG